MARRETDAPIDPAREVSRLLNRLGIIALVVLVPVLALVSRRAVAVFVPLSTILLFFAAGLGGRMRESMLRGARALVAPTGLALILLLAYLGLSLIWTPRLDRAAERLVEVAALLLLFVAVIASLPERARPSDANLTPIGVAIATVLLALAHAPGSPLGNVIGPGNAIASERAAMLIVLLVWPGTAALVARRRLWPGWTLVAALAVTLWLMRDPVILAAFALSGLAFLAARLQPVAATRFFGAIAFIALALAPGFGWLMTEYGGFLIPGAGDQRVAVWRDVTYALPDRLLFGFGFEASAVLQRTISNVPLGSPGNAALQLWLEIGLVGVVLALVVLVLALRAIEQATYYARPAALAVLVAAGTMMFAGLATWETWWITGVGLAAMLTSFVSRTRPRLDW